MPLVASIHAHRSVTRTLHRHITRGQVPSLLLDFLGFLRLQLVCTKVATQLFHEKVSPVLLENLPQAQLRLLFLTNILRAVEIVKIDQHCFISLLGIDLLGVGIV